MEAKLVDELLKRLEIDRLAILGHLDDIPLALVVLFFKRANDCVAGGERTTTVRIGSTAAGQQGSRVNQGECKPTPVPDQDLQPPAKGCKKTYEETLMDVYDYSVEVGLPYRHVQIDSWYVRIPFLSPLASTPLRDVSAYV